MYPVRQQKRGDVSNATVRSRADTQKAEQIPYVVFELERILWESVLVLTIFL